MSSLTDVFEVIPRESTLWKYLDFRKFVSILERQSVYLASPTEFADPFEGSLPPAFREQLATGSMQEQIEEVFQRAKQEVVVDCWHQNEYESAAMWKMYSGDRGIAIQTDAGRLMDSLASNQTLLLRKVQYIDYTDSDMFESFDVFLPYQCKRKSFEHEREVRVISSQIPQTGTGRYHEVDPNTLIATVFVAPDSEQWFYELVELMLNRYGLTKPVRRSTLLDAPNGESR